MTINMLREDVLNVLVGTTMAGLMGVSRSGNPDTAYCRGIIDHALACAQAVGGFSEAKEMLEGRLLKQKDPQLFSVVCQALELVVVDGEISRT